MKVRYENSQDQAAVWEVHAAAFPSEAEANLVNTLRSATDCISLVCEQASRIVGHILFSPVGIQDYPGLKIQGLAPMAVLPDQQNSGIGSELVKAGIRACETAGAQAIVVLGHADFYPKFGFVPSIKYGIRSEYDVPDEVFMILELQPGSLDGVSGTIEYHEAFKNL